MFKVTSQNNGQHRTVNLNQSLNSEHNEIKKAKTKFRIISSGSTQISDKKYT